MKTTSLDQLTDRYIGEQGTPKREAFEQELRMDLIGSAIKQTRQHRQLTQSQLGEIVGVGKAQISKLENSVTDARFETVLRIFRALNAKISFNVELMDPAAGN